MIVVWAKEAENDLEAIVSYIAEDDVDAAIRMDVLFRSKAKELAQYPSLGHEGRISGTRELLAHRNYLLIYRIQGDTVEIVALVHTAQHYPPERLS